MSKLLSFLNRNSADNDNTDAIRRTATATMAHLLERNRKFELFLVEKLADLEKRTGPGRLSPERQSEEPFVPPVIAPEEPGGRAFEDDLDDDELFAATQSFAATPPPPTPRSVPVRPAKPAHPQPAPARSVKPVPPQPAKPAQPVPVIETPADWTALFGLGDENEGPDDDAVQAGANSLADNDGAKGDFD